MIKKEEILEKIEQNEGVYEPVVGMKFEEINTNKGGIVCIYKGCIFRLWDHQNDVAEFAIYPNPRIEDMPSVIAAAQDLAQWLGVEQKMKDGSHEVVKVHVITEQEMEDVKGQLAKSQNELFEMNGKVEAYENILLGRDITAGK